MSRGIRDLRELICVSRLNNVTNNNDDLIDPPHHYIKELEKVAIVNQNSNRTKPSDTKEIVKTGKLSKKSLNTKNSKSANRVLPNISSSDADVLLESMKYINLIDETLLSEWLGKANMQLQELVEWSQDHNAFVNFSNFWLVDLPSGQRRDLLAMEYGILSEEIRAGLAARLQNSSGSCSVVMDAVTQQLLAVAFWEYRSHLSCSSGYYLFLDYLDTLTSSRTDAYKAVLTDVKIVTRDTRLIQALLSTRALALVTILVAVVAFYRNLVDRRDVAMRPMEVHVSAVDVLYTRVCMAICHEFFPTLQYWIQKKKLNVEKFRDEQGRNLLTIAVSYNSLAVLRYFVQNFDVGGIINSVSLAGNSALHLAVCQGSIELVQVLVDEAHADINVINQHCDDSTPLHMAAIYGQEEIAKYLVEHGASATICTASNYTAADMAQLYEQMEMASLLEQMQRVSSSDLMVTEGCGDDPVCQN